MKSKMLALVLMITTLLVLALGPVSTAQAGSIASVKVHAPNSDMVIRPNSTDVDAVVEVTNVSKDDWTNGFYLVRDSGTDSAAVSKVDSLDPLVAKGSRKVVFDIKVPANTGTYKQVWSVYRGSDGYRMEQFTITYKVTGDAFKQGDTSEWSKISLYAPYGLTLKPKQTDADLYVTVKNAGAADFPAGYYLRRESGGAITTVSKLTSGGALPIGSEQTYILDLVAPADDGDYKNTWVVETAPGHIVGRFSFTVRVAGKTWVNPSTTSFVSISVISPLKNQNVMINDRGVDAYFVMKNPGATTWTKDFYIEWVGGSKLTKFGGVKFLLSDHDTAPGGVYEMIIDLKAPGTAGDYTSDWAFKDKTGKTIAKFSTTMHVVKP